MTRALILAALLCSCDFREARNPEPLVEGGTEADCQAACKTLERLGCATAAPTDDGGDCISVCMNVESSGTITTCPAQVARARDCAEAEILSQCEAP